jgi:hypothetical protein
MKYLILLIFAMALSSCSHNHLRNDYFVINEEFKANYKIEWPKTLPLRKVEP